MIFPHRALLETTQLFHKYKIYKVADDNKHVITARAFRTRITRDIKFEGLKRKPHKEIWQAAFLDGFTAARAEASGNPIWKLFTALATGVFIGFFFPFVIAKRVDEKSIIVDPQQIRTKFVDIQGAFEAKQELMEVVHYLKKPELFSKLGGKIPKGLLLVGPPGTGKTMLARALAGEAGVPYFQVSGSEFEQIFVGEGAMRVRNLFQMAKQNAPCVVFIDEIDAVGSKRGHSPLHPHAHQTINQLLTEMDGFNRNEGVIVVAATNRRKDLDAALTRPGRFDVEVAVPLPSYRERKLIIEHYLSKIVTDISSGEELAQGTVGFTGAHIQTMINRSALRAAIAGASKVTAEDVFTERDRLLMGTELKSRIPNESSRKITACHEAGHCVVAVFTPHAQPVHAVSIVPRGDSLGHTAYMPADGGDQVYVTRAQLLARIDSLLGGRAAEDIVFGAENVTSGAEADLEEATQLATKMVTKWGMSEKFGLRTQQDDTNGSANQDIVLDEVQLILKESYERSKNVIRNHSQQHLRLAESLLKNEILKVTDIYAILTST